MAVKRHEYRGDSEWDALAFEFPPDRVVSHSGKDWKVVNTFRGRDGLFIRLSFFEHEQIKKRIAEEFINVSPEQLRAENQPRT